MRPFACSYSWFAVQTIFSVWYQGRFYRWTGGMKYSRISYHLVETINCTCGVFAHSLNWSESTFSWRKSTVQAFPDTCMVRNSCENHTCRRGNKLLCHQKNVILPFRKKIGLLMLCAPYSSWIRSAPPMMSSREARYWPRHSSLDRCAASHRRIVCLEWIFDLRHKRRRRTALCR